MKRSALVTREIDTAALIEEARSPAYGAISTFIGTVREINNGRKVAALEYSAYTAMAESEMRHILEEAAARFDVGTLIVEHRTGQLELGDISIVIVAAREHRAPALDCTRFVIEEIKKRVPIWKMEHYQDGTREWVDPTQAAEIARA
jgi:molybdopterin synthase catalytic subunit